MQECHEAGEHDGCPRRRCPLCNLPDPLFTLTDAQRHEFATKPAAFEKYLRENDIACDGCGPAARATIPTVSGLNGTSWAHCPKCWRKWWEAERPARLARGKAAMAAFMAGPRA
jgi:hypothetical protein